MTVEEIRKMLRYEPDTGLIYWLVDRQKKVKGSVAGYIDQHGYVKIEIAQKNYYGHRLAWAIHHGAFPENHIDHINGDRSDNRILNLRPATVKDNNMNRCIGKNNTSGFVGVSWDSCTEKWVARIRAQGRQMNLGRFDIFDDACKARKLAEQRYGYHQNHGRAA